MDLISKIIETRDKGGLVPSDVKEVLDKYTDKTYTYDPETIIQGDKIHFPDDMKTEKHNPIIPPLEDMSIVDIVSEESGVPYISYVDNQTSANITIRFPKGSTNMEYSIDGKATWLPYTEVFTITETKTVDARCMVEGEEKTASLVVATGKKYIEDFAADPSLQYGLGELEINEAFTNAINSNYKYIEFGKTGTNYKLTNNIYMYTSNKYFMSSNKATIFTDDDFVQKNNEIGAMLIYVAGSNITFDNLKIEARETENFTMSPYTVQMGIFVPSTSMPMIHDITIKNCHFTIPDTVYEDRQWLNLDIWSGWKNVTVEDSIFENYSDNNIDGGNIFARDIQGRKEVNGNLIIKNNEFHSKNKGEIISIHSLRGSISDVKITGNEFTLYKSDIGNDSARVFYFGANDTTYPNTKFENLEFSNNTVVATGDFAFTGLRSCTNVAIKNNDLTFNKVNDEDTGYVFENMAAEAIVGCEISNNRITVNNGENCTRIRSLSNVIAKFADNTIEMNTNVTSLMFVNRTDGIINNNITVNGNLSGLAAAPHTVIGNTVNVTGVISSAIISYNNVSGPFQNLNRDVLIKDNNITVETPHTTFNHILGVFNGVTFNGHTITLENNTVTSPKTTGNANNRRATFAGLDTEDDYKTVCYHGNTFTGYDTTDVISQVQDTMNIIQISAYKVNTIDGISYIEEIPEGTTVQTVKTTLNLPTKYKIQIEDAGGQVLNDTSAVENGSTIKIMNQSDEVLKSYKVRR